MIFAKKHQYFLPILFCLLSCLSLLAQGSSDLISIQNFPQDYQLFPRDLATNIARIELEGQITAGNISEISVKVFRDGQTLNSFSPIDPLGGMNSSFTIPIEIEAITIDHKIELHVTKDGITTVELFADQILAGDIYLINGQSNAEAGAIMDDQDKDPMLRGVESGGNWNDLKFAKPGKWGGRLAKSLLDETHVPIAIFNKAVGGKKLEFYLPNYSDEIPNNYDLVIQNLQESGIGKNVRAVFWFQGEADGWEASVESYKADFKILNDAWKADLNIEQSYIFQLRSGSCMHPKPFVLEAQRQSALEEAATQIMSTSNAVHDSCHFEYENGYQSLGDRLFNLVSNDLYGTSYENAEAPMISKAELVNENEIRLTFGPSSNELSIIGNPFYDFSIADANTIITSVTCSGNQVTLQTDNPVNIGDKVSYLCHPGPNQDYIVNQSDVGILSFSEVEIELLTSVKNITQINQSAFKVFPNPNQGSFNISMDNPNIENLSFKIFDLRGKTVFTDFAKNLGSKINIKELNLHTGMYLLEVLSDDKSLGKSKIIIQ